MKIALDPALIADQPLPASFAAAAEYGYDGIELGNRDDVIPAFAPLAYTPSELRAAKAGAASAGTKILSVAVIQALSSTEEARRAQAVSWWLDGVRAAIDLGCRRINSELSGDPRTPGPCRDAYLRSMETILPVLEREGVTVAVEPHPWDFVETTAAAVDLIGQLGSPAIGYLHCLPHTFYLGGSITEQVRCAGDALVQLHVADTFRPERSIVNPPGLDCRVHQHFDIGAGEVDWREAGHALAGFDGIATVQVFFWPERAAESFGQNRAAIGRIFP